MCRVEGSETGKGMERLRRHDSILCSHDSVGGVQPCIKGAELSQADVWNQEAYKSVDEFGPQGVGKDVDRV
jgi:hypothetical protein